ncbi:MAG: hypothetical protein ACXWNK_17995 [Vulcanimicrobiaceae bacterium]
MRVGLASFILACVAFTAFAEAKGTVRVQQSSGSVQVYRDVAIRIVGKTLRVTTADGTGTLVIDKAACSYVGEVQRCLPYHITLDQGGGAHPIDLKEGTAYVNLTDAKQQLPLSSQQLPPHSILLALSTKIGTYLTMNGEIDR